MENYEFYPVLIDGIPHNLVIRSVRSLFIVDGSFQALPSTIAISIENQGGVGGAGVVIDDVFELASGSPAYNLGGSLYSRRNDLIRFTFTAPGTQRLIFTQDVATGLTPLEFI